MQLCLFIRKQKQYIFQPDSKHQYIANKIINFRVQCKNNKQNCSKEFGSIDLSNKITRIEFFFYATVFKK